MTDYFKPLKHPVMPIHEVFKRYCLRALAANGFNRIRTARQLQISDRTLRVYIEKWKAEGIDIPTRYNWTHYDA